MQSISKTSTYPKHQHTYGTSTSIPKLGTLCELSVCKKISSRQTTNLKHCRWPTTKALGGLSSGTLTRRFQAVSRPRQFHQSRLPMCAFNRRVLLVSEQVSVTKQLSSRGSAILTLAPVKRRHHLSCSRIIPSTCLIIITL